MYIKTRWDLSRFLTEADSWCVECNRRSFRARFGVIAARRDASCGRWSLQCLVIKPLASAHNSSQLVHLRDSFRETSMLRLFTHTYLRVCVYTCARRDRHYLFAERDRSALAGYVSPKQIPVCLRLDIKMQRGKRKKRPWNVCMCIRICVCNEIDFRTRFIGIILYKMFLSFSLFFLHFRRSVLNTAECSRISLIVLYIRTIVYKL